MKARNERIRQLAEQLKRTERAFQEAPWREGLRARSRELKRQIQQESQQVAEQAGQQRLF